MRSALYVILFWFLLIELLKLLSELQFLLQNLFWLAILHNPIKYCYDERIGFPVVRQVALLQLQAPPLHIANLKSLIVFFVGCLYDYFLLLIIDVHQVGFDRVRQISNTPLKILQFIFP